LNERHLFECSSKYTTVNYNLAIVFKNVVLLAWTPSGASLPGQSSTGYCITPRSSPSPTKAIASGKRRWSPGENQKGRKSNEAATGGPRVKARSPAPARLVGKHDSPPALGIIRIEFRKNDIREFWVCVFVVEHPMTILFLRRRWQQANSDAGWTKAVQGKKLDERTASSFIHLRFVDYETLARI
jgi:hypothetical protein